MTIRTKPLNSINVTDFGATGDGVTNDATAFTDAITRARELSTSTSKWSVFAPPGTYLINTTVDFDPDDSGSTPFYGAGQYTTRIRLGMTDGTAGFQFNRDFEFYDFNIGTNEVITGMSDPLAATQTGYCVAMKGGTFGNDTTDIATRGRIRGVHIEGTFVGLECSGWVNEIDIIVANCITGTRLSYQNSSILTLQLENCAKYFEFSEFNGAEIPLLLIEGSQYVIVDNVLGGTVSGNTTSQEIIGVGTSFDGELQSGDTIRIQTGAASANEEFTVVGVANSTSIVVDNLTAGSSIFDEPSNDVSGVNAWLYERVRTDASPSTINDSAAVNIGTLYVEENTPIRPHSQIEVGGTGKVRSLKIDNLHSGTSSVSYVGFGIDLQDVESADITGTITGATDNRKFIRTSNTVSARINLHGDTTSGSYTVADSGFKSPLPVLQNLLGEAGRFPAKGGFITNTAVTRAEASWIENKLYPGHYAIDLRGGASGVNNNTAYIQLNFQDMPEVFSRLNNKRFCVAMVCTTNDDPAWPLDTDFKDPYYRDPYIAPQLITRRLSGAATAGDAYTSNARQIQRNTTFLHVAEIPEDATTWDGLRIQIQVAANVQRNIEGVTTTMPLVADNPNAAIEIQELMIVPGLAVDLARAWWDGRVVPDQTTKLVSFRAGRPVYGYDARGDTNHVAEYLIGDTILVSNTTSIVCTAPGSTTTATFVEAPSTSANGIFIDNYAINARSSNGILVTSDGINVKSSDTTVVVDSSGVSIDDSTISITASQITDDIALGTDTSGDYVASFTAGAGLTGDASGEGSTPTIDVVAANSTILVTSGDIAANTEAIKAAINHDTLTGFVADEHVAHSSISVTAGDGLTGGGTIDGSITLNLVAANGVIADVDSVQVRGANGILVTSAGVNVKSSDTTVLVDSSGVSIDDSTISITASQITDDIALGTDTSGDYVASFTAGDGLTGDASGEGSTPTINVVAANSTILVTSGDIAANTEAIKAAINHDSLTGFVADEHIDHSTITVTAGDGLTGGGTIDGSFSIDIAAANGIISDTNSVQVRGANGILVTTDGVNVKSNDSTVVVDSSGVSINDSTISITASQITDDIALGTDTSGDYVATISGTANEIEITGSGGEGSTPTIGLPTDVTISQLTVSGDLTVSGNTTTVNSNNVLITDPLMELQYNLTGANPNDMGFIFERGSTGDNAVFIWDESEDKFTLGTTTATGNTTGDLTVTSGTLVADLEGSATDAGVLTTDYVASFTAGAGLTGDASGVGSTPTIDVVAANSTILVTSGDISANTEAIKAAINHDSLTGFVADEHVAHSGVDITAGAGLTGGGAIDASRTIDVAAANSTILVTADAIAANTEAIKAAINHDSLTGFVADEHVAHSGVDLTAGAGLTGGGAIDASRTFDVVAANSTILVTADAIAANTEAIKAAINHDSLTGFVADEHVAHSGVDMIAGDGLSGGGTIDSSRTFNVGAANGIIADTDTLQVRAGNTIFVDASGVNVKANAFLVGNSHIRIPAGTTGEQPGSVFNGYLRYNITTQNIEWWNGTAWTSPDTGGGEANQDAWNTFTPDSGGNIEADNSTDTATFAGANGIFTVGTPGTDTVSWNAQGANGILVTTDGINVLASDSTITVTSSGIAVDTSQLGINEHYTADTVTPSVAPTASGTDSLAMGDGASSTSNEGIAIGGSTVVTQTRGIAIGYTAEVTASTTQSEGIAIGFDATVTGTASISIGDNPGVVSGGEAIRIGPAGTATSDRTISIGARARAEQWDAITIGAATGTTSEPLADSYRAIAIGRAARALANSTVAIGGGDTLGSTDGAKATGKEGVAVGYLSHAANAFSVSVGSQSIANTLGSIAVGYLTDARQLNSIAIGRSATVANTDSTMEAGIAIGRTATSSGAHAVALGNQSSAGTGTAAVALGAESASPNAGGIAVGYFANIGGDYAIAIGGGTSAGNAATADGAEAIAIGRSSSATGTDGIAIGTTSGADFANAVAIGNAASSGAQRSVAVGVSASGGGDSSVAVGESTSASQTGNIALGSDAQATGSTAAIAIGDGANSQTNGGIAIGRNTVVSTGSFQIAIGESADATGAGSGVAIGRNSQSSGNGSVAIGQNAVSSTNGGFAVGTNSQASGSEAVAVGGSLTTNLGAQASTGNGGVAIGARTYAGTAGYATAIGYYANSSAESAISIGGGPVGEGAIANDSYAISIGRNSTASAASAISIGGDTTVGATASGITSISIGAESDASGLHAIAIGGETSSNGGAQATADETIAIGSNSDATAQYAIAIGNQAGGSAGAQATAQGAISMGSNSDAIGTGSVAIGRYALANSASSIAIGGTNAGVADQADAGYGDSIAIGRSVKVYQEDAVGMGVSVSVTGGPTNTGSVGIGASATASGDKCVAIGFGASATGDYSFAIGRNTDASGFNSIAFGGDSGTGQGAQASATDSVAIGANARALGVNSLALGSEANVDEGPHASTTGSIAIGSQTNSTGLAAVAIGASFDGTASGGAQATGSYAISIGTLSDATTEGAIAIGEGAQSGVGTDGIAIGTASNSDGTNAISIGKQTDATALNSVAIGGANATGANASGVGAVAIGTEAVASATNAIAIGNSANTGHENSIAMGFNAETTSNNQFLVAFDDDEDNSANFITASYEIHSKRVTTDSVLTSISNTAFVAVNTAVTFVSTITAIENSAAGIAKGWEIRGLARRQGDGSFEIVGDVSKTLVGEVTGTEAWDVDAIANTGLDAIELKGTGGPASVSWFSVIKGTSVTSS